MRQASYKANQWRYALDPRDPDYLDPPTAEEQREEDERDVDVYIESKLDV